MKSLPKNCTLVDIGVQFIIKFMNCIVKDAILYHIILKVF